MTCNVARNPTTSDHVIFLSEVPSYNCLNESWNGNILISKKSPLTYSLLLLPPGHEDLWDGRGDVGVGVGRVVLPRLPHHALCYPTPAIFFNSCYFWIEDHYYICIVPICVIEDLKGDGGRFWPLIGFPLDKNNVFWWSFIQSCLVPEKKNGPCYKTRWLGS